MTQYIDEINNYRNEVNVFKKKAEICRGKINYDDCMKDAITPSLHELIKLVKERRK